MAAERGTGDTVDAAMFAADKEQSSENTVNSFTIVIKIKADKEESSGFKVDSAQIMDEKEESNGDAVKKAKVIAPHEEPNSEDIVDAEKISLITTATKELSIGDTVTAATLPMENASSSVRAEPEVQCSQDESRYRTDFPNMGVCLIINNESFHPDSGMSARRGSNKDEEAVKKTFEGLGYNVIVHRNLTKKQMKQELERVSNEDHSENASFICVILSHGNSQGIFGTDKPVQIEILTEYFKGDGNKTLIGKPKLFFIQACRGEKLDPGAEGRDTIDAVPLPVVNKIPVEADFLYAYATAPGHYAWRNSENGSWFIQSLCEVLPKYKHLELMQIMTRVNRKVAFDFESSNTNPRFHGKKAVPCISTMLTKEFYFSK